LPLADCQLVIFLEEWEVDMVFPATSSLQKSLDNLAVSLWHSLDAGVVMICFVGTVRSKSQNEDVVFVEVNSYMENYITWNTIMVLLEDDFPSKWVIFGFDKELFN